MIDLGPHAVFIVTGYAGAVIGVAALIFWVGFQSHAVKARLAALEVQGVRRRSAKR